MPDIAMCLNEECPLKTKCYRYLARPSQHSQSYMLFKFTMNDQNKPECDDFWELDDWTKLNIRKEHEHPL